MTLRNSAYAARQLARKVKLETILIGELRSWFRAISDTVKPVVRHSGQLPDLEHFRSDMATILRKHYRRVGRAFLGEVSTELSKAWNVKQDQQQAVGDASLAAFLSWAIIQAPQQADYIMNTTQADLQAMYDQAQATLADKGEQGNDNLLAALIVAAFAASYVSRTETIATFETQSSSEMAKLLEADATAQTAGRESAKIWHTVLDARTRYAHVLANLQKKDRQDAFVVNGERMRAPGDTSLGASLGNVINCRCSAEYRGA